MRTVLVLALAILRCAPAAADSWSITGSMNTPHSQFEAVLVPSGANAGQVLAVGGYDGNAATASAELYDPQTGTWRETGSLNVARFNHTLTVLGDGKVLAAGGFTLNNGYAEWLSSAEIFDPDTEQWTPTGDLNTARDKHTATLLGTGKVLVTSGESNGFYLASAELYDPDTREWTETPSMDISRYSGHAELLESGKVLVVGGIVALFFTDLYDPAPPPTGAWASTGRMISLSRYGFITSRIECACPDNGKVLAGGGFNQAGGQLQNSAELYDPVTETWSSTGEMITKRYWPESEDLSDGRVLVVGGSDFSQVLASAEIYDPVTRAWSSAASMSDARFYPQAVRLDSGLILVMGGGSADGPLASAELYLPN